jgi:RNA polymerase sigma-70 factor (ECF subfamily)
MDLVRAVLSKDRKATGEFVSLHADSVYAYLYSRLIPRSNLVEDMVQEVFLAAWEGLGKFHGTSSLKAWLLGIARHKIEDHYRSRLRKFEDLETVQEDAAVSPEPPLDQLLDRRRIEEKARRVA